MDKAFGAQGKIENFPFRDLNETLDDKDGVIEVKDGVMYVGADSLVLLDSAIESAHLHLAIWTERQNLKITVDFNHKWKLNTNGGKDIALEFNDTVKVIDRIQIKTITHDVSIQGKARIITQEMHDSASFKNNFPVFYKALEHPVLKQALLHFSEEVVDVKRPLYGVYKALEAITKHLGKSGRKKLANLAGQPDSYVEDIMETTQTERHNKTDGSRKLDDDECKRRAKNLIDIFSNSLDYGSLE